MTVDETVEVIKAVGSAVSAILGAVGIAYARIAAKRSKEAAQQTTTTQHINGQLLKRSSAQTSEATGEAVRALKDTFDQVLARQLILGAEVAQITGNGRRRADPEQEEHHDHL